MRSIILFIFVHLTLSQYGCAALQPSTTSPGTTFDPTTANIEDILREAENLSDTSQSTRAAKLIERGMLYHPENSQLSAALATYQKLSDQEMGWLESDALVKRALWLRSELRKENVAVIAKPSLWKKVRISRLEVKQKHAHEGLIHCAEKNIENKPELSRRCLDATNKGQLTDQQFEQALALRSQLRRSEIAKIVDEQIVPETRRTPSPTKTTSTPPTTSASPSKAQQEIDALELALNKKDYLWAKQLSNSLKQGEGSNNKETQGLIRMAETSINAYADHIAQRADSLYLQEKVAEADALWLLLIKLNPENSEYRQNHERAEKILKNIKTIKEEHENSEIPANFEMTPSNQD